MQYYFYQTDVDFLWDDVEVHPIWEDDNGFCEVVEEKYAMFWSVYLHRIEGGVECVADVSTKEEAINLSKLILTAAKTNYR